MALARGYEFSYFNCHWLPQNECTMRQTELEVDENDYKVKPFSLTSNKLEINSNMN